MNRNYEMISILNPELTEENIKSSIKKTEKVITKFKGELFSVDEWGKKRLAYPIQKFAEGYYFQLNFAGPHEMIRELDRVSRISEQVLRFQIIRVENAPEITEKRSLGTQESEEIQGETEEEREGKDEMEDTENILDEVKEEEAEENSEEASEADTVGEGKSE